MINKIGGPLFSEVTGNKTPSSAKPSSTPAASQSAGNKSPGTLSNIPEDQKNIVRTMQQIMSSLSDQIIRKRDLIFEKYKDKNIAFKSAAEIQTAAASFSNTAIGFAGSSSADGIWGGNTQKALNQIIDFLKKLSIQNINIIPSPKHNEAKSEDIIKNATSNIDNLSKIFAALDLEAPAEARTKTPTKLDAVGRDLGKEQASDPLRSPFPNPIPVLKEHLETLLRFFDYVTVNNMRVAGVDCKPLSPAQKLPAAQKQQQYDKDDPWANRDNSKAEDGLYENVAYSIAFWDYSDFYKLAQQIKDANIIKAAQDLKSAQPPAEPKSLIQGVCLNQFEQLIYWFSMRANSLANSLLNYLESGDINPLTNKTVTQAEVNAALFYNKMMQGLYSQWLRAKKQIERVIRENNQEDNPILERIMLEDYGYSASEGKSQPGAARTRPGKDGAKSFTAPGENDEGGVGLDSGPLSTWMDFDNLKTRGFLLDAAGEEALRQLEAHEVSLKDWTGQSGTTWQNLAIIYSTKESEVAKIEDIQNIWRNISNVITSLYNGWKKSQEPAPEVLKPQFELAKRWTTALRSMGAAAQRQTSNTGNGGRGQIGGYPMSAKPRRG